MAILIDFSQVVLSSCYVFSEQLNKNQLAQQSAEGGRKRAENIIRHVILSQLLAIKKKFGKVPLLQSQPQKSPRGFGARLWYDL